MSYSRPCRDLTGHDFSVEIGPGPVTYVAVDIVTVVRARDLEPDADDVLALTLRLPTTDLVWPSPGAGMRVSARVAVRGEGGLEVTHGFKDHWDLRRGEVVGEPWFESNVPIDAHILFAYLDVTLVAPGQ
ncbi:hypothetical protein [Clavibacter michiganensis]|uniref:Uncharacterized protein n=1 Tax=Clavibacter michiganensis subsp. insidiosus TaxID=33014 RepID=A0A0D5CI81_9MICO|nr:hypothetical protein [Clavibacter michiganensis]AJW79010.1 hypothetical protein VO01_07605 [Clavibacter michiganensis subsp. insidiosus]AWF98298.1 hypothetical protein BEH61_07240 [Clavibacter michiganensis subsp. insidiosus]AWG01500.1 hypothetical protein BEH62_07830 [Clavibacter michiganensis subsp. insidiosus]OQJ59969.1 hypothetical protein B5P21_08630 [Clavibacter michiganensis subsp. insidiosus]RII88928.1 hypothetical protein DZF92_01050 [Clavibacter michiganensis subsp. insidiosus]